MRFLLLLIAVAVAVAEIPEGKVITPFGIRSKECVLEVDSGSHISETAEGLRVTDVDGTERHITVPEECSTDGVVERYLEQKKNPKVDAFPLNGWLDYGGWYPPTGESNLNEFTSIYTVPGDPAADRGQVLFYFIGMQDNAYAAVNILQPVLTWGNGVKGWNLASWDCCPKNITVQSKTLTGFGAGDTIKGTIKRIDDATWFIDSTVVKTGQNTTLYSEVGDYLYNWADVTLEVYSVTACDEFAKGPMTFSSNVIKDVQGATITPNWSLTKASDCSGVIKVVDSQTVTITHN